MGEHRAYVAGPLFDDGERWFLEQIDELVAAAGFDTFLPHRDNPPKDESTVSLIYENDKSAIDRCDVIVANLNGPATDDGTAWELGYAYANGKYLIGLHTDGRRRLPDQLVNVNLMVERSLHRLVHSLAELKHALADWKAAR